VGERGILDLSVERARETEGREVRVGNVGNDEMMTEDAAGQAGAECGWGGIEEVSGEIDQKDGTVVWRIFTGVSLIGIIFIAFSSLTRR